MNKAELAVFEIQKQMYEDKEFFGKSATNPFYNSKYVPLNDLLMVIVPKLHEKDCKLKHDMEPTHHAGFVKVTCIVTHVNGDTDTSSAILPLEVHEVTKKGEAVVKLNGQEAGKAFTYGRRYSTAPLFGIPEHDDDCEGAMKRPDKKPAKKAELTDPYPYLISKLREDKINLTREEIRELLLPMGFKSDSAILSAGSPKIISIIKTKLKGDA